MFERNTVMIWIEGRLERHGRIHTAFNYIWGGLTSLGVICVVVALWQEGSLLFGEFILPAPLPVFQRAWDIVKNYDTSEIDVTLYRAVFGLSIALSVGIAMGLLAGTSKTLALFFRPLISLLLGMPPIIWVVLALFWFGLGDGATIFTILISVIPMCFASAMRGMITVNTELEEMLDSFRVGFWRKIRHLYIPHLINYILPSLTVAIGVGIKVTIMAELLGSTEGMGSKIQNSRAMLDTPETLAYVLVILAIILFVEYAIIEPIRIFLMPWEETRGAQGGGE